MEPLKFEIIDIQIERGMVSLSLTHLGENIMLDTTEQTKFNDCTQLRELEEELNGNKFEFDIRGYWDSIVKMEIPSTEPNIQRTHRIFWIQLQRRLYLVPNKKSNGFVYSLENIKFSDGDWKLNGSGHYECVTQFDGSFGELKINYLVLVGSKMLMLTSISTHKKIGHTSYRWNENDYPSRRYVILWVSLNKTVTPIKNTNYSKTTLRTQESFSWFGLCRYHLLRWWLPFPKVTHEGYQETGKTNECIKKREPWNYPS